MRSTKTEKYAAFFDYMGADGSILTDKLLEQIETQGSITDWLCKRLGVQRGNKQFEEKNQRWWEGDRFILHPKLYHTDIHFYLKRDLPELLATYVRGQFTGSSEKITKKKIEDTVQVMLKENPTWWHDKERKKIFLNRFSIDYPTCCDGKKSSSKASSPAKTQRLSTTNNKPSPSRVSPKKKGKSNVNLVIGIIVIVILLYLVFR